MDKPLTPSEIQSWQAYSDIPEPSQRNEPIIDRLKERGLMETLANCWAALANGLCFVGNNPAL